MRFSTCMVAALVMSAFAAAPVRAQDFVQRGVDVFEAVCAACHVKGEGGAPKIGDRNAWAKRAAQGQTGLANAAIDGIRPIGGKN